MRILIVIGMLLSGVTHASTDSKNACPDLRGDWTCSLEINNFPEPAVSTSYRNTQKDLKDGEVAYEIGGWEFTAKPDVVTPVKGEIDGITSTCKESKLVLSYRDDMGVACAQTIARKSSTEMTAEVLCDISETEGNRSTAYFCSTN